jgi:ferredoxin--NADP+ reductase
MEKLHGVVLKNQKICANVHEMMVHAPAIAAKAKAGQFVIVMVDSQGERIPLTIADYDEGKGTITLVTIAVGTSTRKIISKKEGDSLFAIIGPLGTPSEIESFEGAVVMVGGGLGLAPTYVIAKRLKSKGNEVIVIQGARSREFLFWQDKIRTVCDELIVSTDDGSEGIKGRVTEPLRELLSTRQVGCVYTIGPLMMMKACSDVTREFGVKTVASLNSTMVDGTGMCGGCRVSVGGKIKFTCVDGPEFDAHLVDWDNALLRGRMYVHHEKCSLDLIAEKMLSAK